MSVTGVRVAARTPGSRCPWCHDGIATARTLDCERCGTAQHACCWNEGATCAACGLGGARRAWPASDGVIVLLGVAAPFVITLACAAILVGDAPPPGFVACLLVAFAPALGIGWSSRAPGRTEASAPSDQGLRLRTPGGLAAVPARAAPMSPRAPGG